MGPHPTAQELAAFVGGLLAAAAREPLEAHLATCERCRGEVQTMQGMGLGATASEVALADTHTPAPRTHSAELDLAAGVTVGRYVVQRRLGQGAMGQVFVAHDPRLDRQVAVKLLRHDVPAVENKPLRLRLEREAQALARLSHPNVVAVHDLGDHGDSLFIAMDYVEGETLSDWLRTAHAWPEVQRVFLQAGEGLAAAHRAGLVHRDFKPDNVLVGTDGVVRVSDFGVSRRVDLKRRDRDEETITGAGSLIGTPAYMSPEQFDGMAADARSDQFSFCVALYEALVGRRPYRAESLRELREVLHAGGARFPEESEVPRWLQALVLKGLSVTRSERFPSMDELLVALRGPRRWSRALVGALGSVGVLAVLAAVLGARELERRRTDPCFQIDARAAAAWAPELRQRLEAGVLKAGVPWAADTARQLQATFDGFLVRWRDDYRAACAEVERTSGPERARALAQQACLDARFDAFGRYRAAFEAADAAMVRQGARGVASALLAKGCGGVDVVLELPSDPAQRAAFTSLRARFLDIEADVRLGRSRDLRPELKAGREEADARGFRALAAAFRLLEAWEVLHREPIEAAVAVFEDTALRAEVARDDWLLFRTRLELTKLLAEQVDAKRARALFPALRAVLERLGEDPEKNADVLHAEAVLLSAEGQVKEAMARQQAAIAARDPEDPYRFHALESLSLLQSRLGLYDESLVTIAEAKAQAKRTLGAQHPTYALTLVSEAAQLHRAQRIEESFAVTAEALRILEKDPDTREYVLTLYNHGVLLSRLGRLPEALPVLEKAVALAAGLGEVARLATMHAGYAETLQEAGRLQEALVQSEQALVMAERAGGAQSLQLARPLAVHGALLEALGRYADAAAVLERALALQQGPSANAVLRDITRYDLARVRWQDKAQRRAAVDEVKAVREAFVARGARFDEYVKECDVWLAKHPPR